MEQFYDEFEWHLERFGLLKDDVRVALAFSGGIDSVVLAHLLHRAGRLHALVHVNFQLRGEESDGDEAFAQAKAAELGVPFLLKRFRTAEEAGGGSIQMLARRLRYDWFAQLYHEGHFDFLATAHHANDALETAIFNLTKGTGLAGLAGIAPLQGFVVRPLLFAGRRLIQDYAFVYALEWRQDSSNASDKYARNLIRNRVMPELERINPSMAETSVQSFERLRMAWEMVQKALEDWKNTHLEIRPDGWLLRQEALAHPQALLLLHEFLKDFGFTYEEAYTAFGLDEPGKYILSATHVFFREREGLLLAVRSPVETPEPIQIHSCPFQCEWNGKVLKINYLYEEMPKPSPSIALLDMAKVRLPLQLRTWQAGDKIAPLGMKGMKKNVSDLLNEAKIPHTERAKASVLVNGDGEILWVLGLRISERHKAGPESKEVLEARFL